MIHAQGHVPTPEAGRWLKRLCHHFSRKIAVRYDERAGRAEFPWGVCEMRAEGDALHFACAAASPEALARVRAAIDAHVALFSRKHPLAVRWHAGVDAPGESVFFQPRMDP